MNVIEEIIGNIHSPEWDERLKEVEIRHIPIDQWTAQKSRFLVRDEEGKEYPVALRRQTQVTDGDLIVFDPEGKRAVALKLELNPVMVIDLERLKYRSPEEIIRRSTELGHAIGNQHWPAVVKGMKVYVPLTVDEKVMKSVMETHRLEGISFHFQPGREIIPYLAPHEIRRLFGGSGQPSHAHHSHTENGQTEEP